VQAANVFAFMPLDLLQRLAERVDEGAIRVPVAPTFDLDRSRRRSPS